MWNAQDTTQADRAPEAVPLPLCCSAQGSISTYFEPDIVLDSGETELKVGVPLWEGVFPKMVTATSPIRHVLGPCDFATLHQ